MRMRCEEDKALGEMSAISWVKMKNGWKDIAHYEQQGRIPTAVREFFRFHFIALCFFPLTNKIIIFFSSASVGGTIRARYACGFFFCEQL